MATPADVRGLFEARLKEGIPNPPGDFHPADLERVKDDNYIRRILSHHESDVKLAADMLWDIMVWRKTVGASEINESNVRIDYLKEGIFFPHGRDVDGNLLLIIKSKLHVKGHKDFEDLKKCVIYWFDRIERQENGKPITLFFDLDSCGLGNIDMELIKYLILLMKQYYPYFLHYIIIHQMPWVLSAVFKVVKSLLPPKAIERMKFTSKENLKDFVAAEQALVAWGGKDEYVFEFVSENRNETPGTQKKVTFAEQGDQHSPGEMMRLVPNDTILFSQGESEDDLSGQITITNMDENPISYKIRTTSPLKFRVRCSSGVLARGASQTVLIVVQPGFEMHTVNKDRFLVMSVQIPTTDLTSQEISDVWQNSSGSKVDEYRLTCQFPEKELAKNCNVLDRVDKTDSVTNALNNLQMNYEMLNRNVRTLKIYQLLTLILTCAVVVLVCLIYKVNMDSEGTCHGM